MSTAGAAHIDSTAAASRGGWRQSAARLGRCFMLGAVLGTLLDGIHAYGDVLAYPDTAFGRWAWFVPLEFGLVGAGVGLAMPALERAVAAGERLHWAVSVRALELGLFAGLYFLTTLADSGGEALVLAGALIALVAARLLVQRTPGDWAYVAAAAVLGPVAEAILSALGAFEYLDPDVAGIPYWLPALWANGGLLIRRLIRPIVMPDLRTGADRS